MSNFFSFTSTRARFAVACASLLVATAAPADVKMVSRMTSTSSMGQAPLPQTITAYFKKGLMRSDVGTISTIMNAKTHQNLIIDHTKKTYSQFDMLGAMNARSAMLKDMKVDVSGSVRPTNQKKTIAGKAAQLYLADFVMTMSMPQMKGQKQTMKMHMEQWATKSVPAALSASQMMGVMGTMFQGLPGFSNMNKLVKEFGKIKGFPLDNKMVMTMAFALPKGQARPQGMPSSMTFGFENHVISLKEGPVDAGLFKVPAGYKKAQKPIMPRMGKGG